VTSLNISVTIFQLIFLIQHSFIYLLIVSVIL